MCVSVPTVIFIPVFLIADVCVVLVLTGCISRGVVGMKILQVCRVLCKNARVFWKGHIPDAQKMVVIGHHRIARLIDVFKLDIHPASPPKEQREFSHWHGRTSVLFNVVGPHEAALGAT